jgi:hypothetical protein
MRLRAFIMTLKKSSCRCYSISFYVNSQKFYEYTRFFGFYNSLCVNYVKVLYLLCANYIHLQKREI